MPSSTSDTFLRTKIRVMRPPPGTIARLRLDEARAEALQMRLVTLTAPGGFGKSTLAATWVAHWQTQGHHCTWLSLSQDDDEPARFLHSLTQALQRLGQGVGDAALALLQGRALAAPRAVVSLLLNDLESFDGEAVLVLDDYHWLHEPAIHEAMAFLINHAPPQFHLVITSRVAPPLALARLRAHGQWLDVDAAALRFDEEETTRFLASACALAPTPEQSARLHAGTEGWAAALRLAALGQSLTGAYDTDGTRSSSSVFATLFEDLLESLPPPTVRFMAQTAVLERIHPDLCDAVCDSNDSAAQISVLLQYHLLTEPMDGEGRWLRYHLLLREHLLANVAQRLGVDPRMMHQRAAHWFANQGAWTDAVRHALQAGDSRQAIAWLAHCCMSLVKSGDLLTLLGWRRQLPPELLHTQPQVQLAVAWGLALAMRFAEAAPLLDEIEHAAQQTLEGQALHDTLGECLAIRAVNVALQDDSLQAHAIAQQWHAHGHAGDAFTRNVMSNVMRYVYWKSGDLVRVYEQPWVATPPDDEQQIAFSTVYRQALLGCIELQKGRLGLAERHAREALRCAHSHGGAHSVSMALAAPLMAMLHYQQGRSAEAERLLTPLLPLIDNTAMHEALAQAYQVLVNTAYLQEQHGRAFELLERAEAMGYNRGWDRLVGTMLLDRIRLLVFERRLDEANATAIRIQRLASQAQTDPPCARADLLVLRDIASARIALANQRINEARSIFSSLLQAAQASSQDLRALQIGTCLAIAHMAGGEQEACFAQLRTTLQGAQRSGALRSVLDEGDELYSLLPRFLVSRECDGELADYVRGLIATTHTGHGAAAETRSMLTRREIRVIELVEQGRSNKDIARSMNISAETVKTHLKNIFEKLGVQHRSQAVLMARSLGLMADHPL
ncbi:MAG: LuxR C-terminal-related transcriptional regulator [Giesbergeria sp.]|nr:LuxR C-terminal-related transcriptional regulator [Giesbergeria sp.]